MDYDSPQKNWVYKPKAEEQDRSARTLTKEETELMEEQDDDFTPDEEDGNEEEPSYDRKKSKSKKKTSGRTSTTTSNEGDNSAGGDESGGTADSEGDGEGDTAAGAGDTSSTGESTEGTGDDSTGGGEDSAGNNEEAARNQGNSGSESTGGAGGAAQVYNDTTYTKLPEDAATVAATGDYALIVCMLAGGDDSHKSPLVAADEEFLSGKAMKAFADEGVTTKRVKQGWSGDGTKSGEADVKAIIKADPDVVLVGTDDASLSQDEADQLMAKGIDVVVMPRMGSLWGQDSDIVTAVNVVGTLLDGANTLYDTKDMASKYEEFHDSVIDYDVSGSIPKKNGGYCTGYSAWGFGRLSSVDQLAPGDNASMEGLHVDGKVSGSYRSTYFASDWASYIGSGNVTGSGGVGVINLSDGVAVAPLNSSSIGYFRLYNYYLQCGGVDSPGSIINTTGSNYLFSGVTASAWNDTNFKTRDGAVLSHNLSMQTFISATKGLTANDGTKVSGFIVRDESMANAVRSSASKSNGAWNTDNDYVVLVMPSGLGGSWADGSVESFLIAPWIYAIYQEGGNLDTACTPDYVEKFYDTFYRADYSQLLDEYGTSYLIHSAS